MPYKGLIIEPATDRDRSRRKLRRKRHAYIQKDRTVRRKERDRDRGRDRCIYRKTVQSDGQREWQRERETRQKKTKTMFTLVRRHASAQLLQHPAPADPMHTSRHLPPSRHMPFSRTRALVRRPRSRDAPASQIRGMVRRSPSWVASTSQFRALVRRPLSRVEPVRRTNTPIFPMPGIDQRAEVKAMMKFRSPPTQSVKPWTPTSTPVDRNSNRHGWLWEGRTILIVFWRLYRSRRSRKTGSLFLSRWDFAFIRSATLCDLDIDLKS